MTFGIFYFPKWNFYLFGIFVAVLADFIYGKSTKPESYSGDNCFIERRGGAASRGIITSHNYPLPYPLGACYEWTITAKVPGEVITLSFKDLDLHAGPGGECNLDYIEIGPTPNQYKQCGSIPDKYPPPFISVKSHVWVRFVSAPPSDVRGSRRGFSLTYIIGHFPANTCQEDEFRCNNNKCVLNSWRCNGGDECGDGSDEAGCNATILPTPPADNSCGKDKFVCVSASTKLLTCFLELQRCNGKVDCLSGEDEQHCDSKKKCGKILSSDKGGYFTSPNFPNKYPMNIDCEWVILVPQKDVIQLRFDVFQLESGYNTDYITIYDGQDQNSDQIGRFYGKRLPPPVIQSTSYKMFVKFHSDASITQLGFNVTYQVKGVCLSNQFSCGFREKECYVTSLGCDGKWDCPLHGGDERGCGTCKADEFACEKETQCYAEKERCDGKPKCRNSTDEKHCTPDLCGPLNGTFLCKDSSCIQETWHCDNQADCADGSDEINCPVTTRVVTAAVIGSLICGLLLVIALGCTCKLYALRMQDHYGPRYETPLTRIQNQIARRRAPPPYNEAMITSRPFDEVQRERQEQLRSQGQAGDSTAGSNNNTVRNTSSGAVENAGSATTPPPVGINRNTSDSSLSQTVDIVTAGCVAQWRRTRPEKHVRRAVNEAGNEAGSSSSSSGSTMINEDAGSASASLDSVMVSVDGDSVKPAETGSSQLQSTNANRRNIDRHSSVNSASSDDSQLLDTEQAVTVVRTDSVSSLESTCSDTRLLL